MNTGKISFRYAKALYDHAVASNLAKEVYDHSSLVSDIFASSSEFCAVLRNPVILTSDKEKLVQRVFSGKINPLLSSFILMMVKKRREAYITNALLVYRKMYREKEGFVKVVVETPVELAEETKNKILEFIKSKFDKKPELEVIVKPELIGGLVVEVEGLLIDLSISGQLTKVRKALIHESKVI